MQKAKKRGAKTMENIKSNFDVRKQWWDKLGEVLKEKNIDINSETDLARLMIFNCQIDRAEETYEATPYFATDTEQRPIEAGITVDEVMKRQKKGIPDERLFWRIYDAAQEGRLFLHNDGSDKGVAIEVNEKGDPKECFDVDNPPEGLFSREMSDGLYKPVKPSKPWGITYVLAFFGSSAAKDKINRYDKAMKKYTRKTENWNKVQELGESLATRRRNQHMVFYNYFHGLEHGDEVIMLGGKAAKDA